MADKNVTLEPIGDQFYFDLDKEVSDSVLDNYKKLELEADKQIFESLAPEERPVYAKQVYGSLARAGLQIEKAIAHFPIQLGLAMFNIPEYVSQVWGREPKYWTEKEALEHPGIGPYYKKFVEDLEAYTKHTLERHPEWNRNPPEKFLDLLTNPRELALTVTETIPLIASSIGLTLIGRPDLSMTLMTATEGQDAKDRITAMGGTEEQANMAYWSYGIPAAVIEQYLNVKPAIKLGKAAYQRALTKGAQEMAKRGAKEGGKYLLPIVQETIEEPLQGAWQDWTVSAIMGTPAVEGGLGAYVDRRAQEALVSFVTALIPGVGGYGAGKARSHRMSSAFRQEGMPKGFANTLSQKIVEEGKDVITAMHETFEPPVAEGTYTGDILVEKKKIIDLITTPITDQASLEEFGKMICKYQGIENYEDIKWIWSEKKTKRRMGTYNQATNTVTVFGLIHEADQVELKKTIVEEIAHKVKPPKKIYLSETEKAAYRVQGMSEEQINKMWKRRSIHHKEFKQWMDNTLEAVVAIPIEKPVTETVAEKATLKPATIKVFHGTSKEAAQQIKLTGFKAGATEGMTSQPIKEFVFVTPYKAGAKWYGEQNIRFKSGYEIIEAELEGELYEVKKATNEYGAMGIFAKDIGLMKPEEHKLDLPTIANELRSRGYSGIKFKDSVSNRTAYAVLPERLKLVPKTIEEKPKRLTRKKAFDVGHDVPEILGWSEEKRRDFMKQTIGVESMKDVPKGKKGMEMLHKLTDALNQKMKEAGLVYEKPELPTKELIAQLEKTAIPGEERPIKVINRRGIKKLKDEMVKKVHNIGALFARMERYLEGLDGRKEGIFYNTFWILVNDTCNFTDSTVNQEISVFMSEIENRDIDTVLWMGKTDKVTGTDLELTATQRIGVYMLSQNKTGLKRLVENMGMTEDEITVVTNALSNQEKEIAEWLLDKYDAQWKIIQVAAAQAGIDLKTLKKEFRYSPIVYRDISMEEQEDFLSELAEPFRQEGFKPEAGMIEKRVKTTTGRIELDAFALYMNNIARVERFIRFAPIAHKLGKVLNNREFKQALNDRTYGQGSKLLNEWLKDSIRGSSAESTTMVGRMLAIMRQNGIVYAIGYNIPSALRQTLSGFTAMAVDPLMMKYQPLNIIRAATIVGYKNMENFVYSKAPEFKHRNMDRDMRRKWNRVTIKRNLTFTKFGKRMKKIFGAVSEGDLKTAYMYYKSKTPFSQSACRWIRTLDKYTVVISWKSLYDCAIERGKSEQDAIAFANKGIYRTQPMGEVQHLPQFFRGGSLEKLISTFQNFINQYGNFYYYDIYQAKKHGDIGWSMLGYRVMMSWILPAIFFGMIGRARLPKDWKEIGTDLGTYPIAPIIIVGRLIDRMIRGWGNSGTIVETGPEAVVAAGRAALRGDADKAIKEAVKAIAALGGVPPTAQMIRTTEGAIDLMAGTTQDPRRLIYSQWALDQGKEKTAREPGQIRVQRMQARPRHARIRARGY